MTTDELMALGLPSLPDGQFYRVYSDSCGAYYLQIRKHRRFGSKCLEEAHTYPTTTMTLQDVFSDLWDQIQNCRRQADLKEFLWKTLETYEGDHE